MSAVESKKNLVSLDLAGSKEFPRRLSLVIGSVFSVAMFPPNSKHCEHSMLVFASGELARCRLDCGPHAALWVGSTSFDVSEDELQLISDKFGLRVTT